MHFFYIDESGIPSIARRALEKRPPWFVLTAAGFPSEQWHALNAAITDLKRKYFPGRNPWDVEIKSVYIRSWGTDRSEPPWSLLDRSALDAFVDEYYALYDTFGITLFSVAIDKPAHVAKYSKPGMQPRDPYEYAFTNILERIDLFLHRNDDEVGLCFLDEFKAAQRRIIARYIWYRRRGTWVKTVITNVVEPPSFVSSKSSQMISLADIAGYNVYHAYTYRKADYAFLGRIVPYFDRKPGTDWIQGYGLKVLPTQKMPGE